VGAWLYGKTNDWTWPRIIPTYIDQTNRHLLYAPVVVGVADDGKWAIEIKASFEAVWWTIYSQRYMPR
jgi:hypothetical protein